MNPTCEVISVEQDMVLGDVTATEGEPMVLFDEESNNGNKSLSQQDVLMIRCVSQRKDVMPMKHL